MDNVDTMDNEDFARQSKLKRNKGIAVIISFISLVFAVLFWFDIIEGDLALSVMIVFLVVLFLFGMPEWRARSKVFSLAIFTLLVALVLFDFFEPGIVMFLATINIVLDQIKDVLTLSRDVKDLKEQHHSNIDEVESEEANVQSR